MDVAGSSAGGVFKHRTHVTSCSQERHFLKLWLIYGGVGACIMPVYFTSWSQYTQPFLLFPSDHKHMRRLHSALTSFYFCFLYSPCWLPNLLDCPLIIFPQNPFSWCPLVPPAFFWVIFPTAFGAALSQQLSHAAQLLSLVLHPRFSHLAHMELWLGPFSWDTEISLLVTHMHRALGCMYRPTDCFHSLSQTGHSSSHCQSPWSVRRAVLFYWFLFLPTPVPVCWACLCHVTQPNFATRWSAPLILPLRRKSSCECVCVHASFDRPWLNLHVRSKKCTFTKSRREMMEAVRGFVSLLCQSLLLRKFCFTQRHIES